jgi:hypothetical protein
MKDDESLVLSSNLKGLPAKNSEIIAVVVAITADPNFQFHGDFP